MNVEPVGADQPAWSRVRLGWALGGLVLLVASPAYFAAQVLSRGTQVVDCSAEYYGCALSPREIWWWGHETLAGWVAGLGAFIAFLALVGPGLAASVRAQRVLTRICLTVAVVVAGLFGLLYLVVSGTTCGGSDEFCFGGHDDAVALGWPGLVAAAIAVFLAVGAVFAHTGFGRACRVVGLLVVLGGIVAAAASTVTVDIVGSAV